MQTSKVMFFGALIAVFIVALASGVGMSFLFAHPSTRTITLTETVSTTFSSTSRETSCVRVGEGWAFYIKVVSDNTKEPVAGAKIDARSYVHCSGIFDNANKSSLIPTGNLYSLVTPANGTVQLPTATIDGYYFTVFSFGLSFPFETFLPPGGLITNATVSVPSGNLTISYYPPST